MILYITSIETAFTIRDKEMISPHFKLRSLTFTDKALALPFYFIIQMFQLLIYLPKTTQYLCFFGGYHTVWPVIFGKVFKKRVIIQCGGTDAMHLPNINYGNYRKKWLKKATVFSFKNCSLILPVSSALVKSTYTYDNLAPRKQGLLNLIPDLTTPIKVVHNGFDQEFWVDTQLEKEPFTFVTVATGISKQNRAFVKGIDLIVQLAEKFTNYTFKLVGDANFETTLPNITAIPAQPKEGIRQIFQEAQFYLQLSASEGFPNSLAEAMLCGCVPIGSQVGEISNIIGETGFVLRQKNIHDLIQIIHILPQSNYRELRIQARRRIVEHYTYSKRKEKILEILADTSTS
ncbi:MAG TPA: glycosyltransferase family 4 protein [Lunatimonas sp.]|nr:glycosyltransferase family 4 protein [Lunatimonas sp.]